MLFGIDSEWTRQETAVRYLVEVRIDGLNLRIRWIIIILILNIYNIN